MSICSYHYRKWLQIDCSIYKQNPEIDWSSIDLLCTCIANAVRRLAGLTSGSVCKFIKETKIDMLTNNLVAPQRSRHFVTWNSVHSDAAIPTKMGGYLRNKQSKSTIDSFYENRWEENQEGQLESCARFLLFLDRVFVAHSLSAQLQKDL